MMTDRGIQWQLLVGPVWFNQRGTYVHCDAKVGAECDIVHRTSNLIRLCVTFQHPVLCKQGAREASQEM